VKPLSFLIGLGLGASPLASAQPAFDVDSVRPTMGFMVPQFKTDPGMLVTRSQTLKVLIEQAYGVSALRIFGGPGWLDSDRFDIEAKADGSHTRGEILQMLQTLLANRFKLSFHRELRELSVAALTLAKGPQALQPVDETDPPDPLLGPHGVRSAAGVIGVGFKGQRMSMQLLSNALSGRLDEIVVDQTGLPGEFDFEVAMPLDPDASNPAVPEREIMQRLFRNLVAKLGLKLESRKAPVEVLVLDHAEQPSPN
jgi:uncharacterized protein (TIGR03435 family)